MRSGRLLVALFAVILVINGYVFPTLARRLGEHAGAKSFLPLDLRPLYAPNEAYEALTALGEAGRRLYQMIELSVDLLYPVAYGLFFFLLIRRMLGGAIPASRWGERAAALPLVAMSLDLAENGLIVAMIAGYPARVPALAVIASATTAAKLACLGLTLLLALYAGARWFVSRRRARAPT